MAATVLRLGEQGWGETEVTQGSAGVLSAGGDTLDLPEIGVALPLAAIYRGLRLDRGASDPK